MSKNNNKRILSIVLAGAIAVGATSCDTKSTDADNTYESAEVTDVNNFFDKLNIVHQDEDGIVMMKLNSNSKNTKKAEYYANKNKATGFIMSIDSKTDEEDVYQTLRQYLSVNPAYGGIFFDIDKLFQQDTNDLEYRILELKNLFYTCNGYYLGIICSSKTLTLLNKYFPEFSEYAMIQKIESGEKVLDLPTVIATYQVDLEKMDMICDIVHPIINENLNDFSKLISCGLDIIGDRTLDDIAIYYNISVKELREYNCWDEHFVPKHDTQFSIPAIKYYIKQSNSKTDSKTEQNFPIKNQTFIERDNQIIGCDISSYQEIENWNTFCSNIGFCIVKANEGRIINDKNDDYLINAHKYNKLLFAYSVYSDKQNIETDYTIQEGDNLWNIAEKYGISVDELKNENNLSSDVLQIGQVLKIPTSTSIEENINSQVDTFLKVYEKAKLTPKYFAFDIEQKQYQTLLENNNVEEVFKTLIEKLKNENLQLILYSSNSVIKDIHKSYPWIIEKCSFIWSAGDHNNNGYNSEENIENIKLPDDYLVDGYPIDIAQLTQYGIIKGVKKGQGCSGYADINSCTIETYREITGETISKVSNENETNYGLISSIGGIKSLTGKPKTIANVGFIYSDINSVYSTLKSQIKGCLTLCSKNKAIPSTIVINVSPSQIAVLERENQIKDLFSAIDKLSKKLGIDLTIASNKPVISYIKNNHSDLIRKNELVCVVKSDKKTIHVVSSTNSASQTETTAKQTFSITNHSNINNEHVLYSNGYKNLTRTKKNRA